MNEVMNKFMNKVMRTEKVYAVVKDSRCPGGYRGYSVMGLFHTRDRAVGCMLRVRDNVRKRLEKVESESVDDYGVTMSDGKGYGCRVDIREHRIGEDLSFLDALM